MSPDLSSQLLTQMLWKGLLVASPLLLVVLLVGVLISVVQVVTQVQEMSLAFVPKLLACVLVLTLGGTWMLQQLVSYSSSLYAAIPSLLR
jgi:flagellar biosynthetic protein FliQ